MVRSLNEEHASGLLMQLFTQLNMSKLKYWSFSGLLLTNVTSMESPYTIASSGTSLTLAKFPLGKVTVELVVVPSGWMMSMLRKDPSHPLFEVVAAGWFQDDSHDK